MKALKLGLFLAVILVSVGLFSSCDKVTEVVANVLFTDQDDITLGQQVVAEMSSQSANYPPWTGTDATNVKYYLNNTLLPEILKSGSITKRNIYKYNIDIVRDTILNAFALPGGPIYVYTGILKYMDSEAALAGVLGHEVAHAELRHAIMRMTQQYGVQYLLNIALGKNPSELQQLVAGIFSNLYFLKNSRDAEDDADRHSVMYLTGSKYYPGAVKFFFEKMKQDGLLSGGGKVETFLSTHPDPAVRIDSTNRRLQSAGVTTISYDYTGSQFNLLRTEYDNNVRSKVPTGR